MKIVTFVEYGKYRGFYDGSIISRYVKKGIITSDSIFQKGKKKYIIVDKADAELLKNGYEFKQKKEEEEENIPTLFDHVQSELTEKEKLERQKKEREEFDKIKELQKNLAENEDDNNVPDVDDSQAEWNKYWIMERALKTALERKKLEKTLIDVEEAKELIGKFLNPIVQDMDALAYDFKNYFPQADESMIDFLFNFIENVKKRSQRNVL